MDAEFKTHHYSVVDAVDDETTLAEEQEILDEHDDTVNLLTGKLQKILKSNLSATRVGTGDMQSRKPSHLERTIDSSA